MKTPHKMLYGKGIDLSHLRIIDAREFVDVEDVTTLDHASWEGMVCGFSRNKSNSFRSWNLKTLRVVEKRNGVFIETPPRLCPPSG